MVPSSVSRVHSQPVVDYALCPGWQPQGLTCMATFVTRLHHQRRKTGRRAATPVCPVSTFVAPHSRLADVRPANRTRASRGRHHPLRPAYSQLKDPSCHSTLILHTLTSTHAHTPWAPSPRAQTHDAEVPPAVIVRHSVGVLYGPPPLLRSKYPACAAMRGASAPIPADTSPSPRTVDTLVRFAERPSSSRSLSAVARRCHVAGG
jgi:hypothetical protein